MKRASAAVRLDRLAARGRAGDVGRTIRGLAEQTGLGVAEVRAEWDAVEERTRRFGPRTVGQVVRQCAEAFGLPQAEIWAEYERITGKGEITP